MLYGHDISRFDASLDVFLIRRRTSRRINSTRALYISDVGCRPIESAPLREYRWTELVYARASRRSFENFADDKNVGVGVRILGKWSRETSCVAAKYDVVDSGSSATRV